MTNSMRKVTTSFQSKRIVSLFVAMVALGFLSTLGLFAFVHINMAQLESTATADGSIGLPFVAKGSDTKGSHKNLKKVPSITHGVVQKPSNSSIRPSIQNPHASNATTSKKTTSIRKTKNQNAQQQKHQSQSSEHAKVDATSNISKTSTTPIGMIHGNETRSIITPETSRNFIPHKRILPPPVVPLLGVLVDAGRHMFPLEWLYNLLETLASLRYNLVHFRLTDDQLFSIQMDELAPHQQQGNNISSPSSLFYTQQELRDFVRHAKSVYNITIIPEINVPGHAGAWGPEWVVPCPIFSCATAYGLPLNVTHPGLPTLLSSILKQVVDVFDNPPFLHLGGDEIWMSSKCLKEVGIDLTGEWYDTVVDFEKRVLTEIVTKELGYKTSQIVRWEHQQDTGHYRTGDITQFWETFPKEDYGGRDWIASTGLYMDQIRDNANGWGDYKAARALLEAPKPPSAIIVGTFELSTQYWVDRNVRGRLLAVSMAVTERNQTLLTATDFKEAYIQSCLAIGWETDLCQLEGQPSVPAFRFRDDWMATWKQWHKDTCDALAYKEMAPHIFQSRKVADPSSCKRNAMYWSSVLDQTRSSKRDSAHTNNSSSHPLLQAPQRIGKAGVVLDVVNNWLAPTRVKSFFSVMQTLGLDMVQMKLAHDDGVALSLDSLPHIGYRFNKGHLYNRSDIQDIVTSAESMGVEIIPEISITTNAGGWYRTGFLVDCHHHFCNQRRSVPLNTTGFYDGLLPLVLTAIEEVNDAFFNSDYFHLGYDERLASEACFKEAKLSSNWETFERKLSLGLQLLGIDLDKVVRWENTEKRRYFPRSGEITQYTTTSTAAASAARATVDAMTSSDDVPIWGAMTSRGLRPWEIYQEAREWNRVSPARLLMEYNVVDNGNNSKALSQLVAFAIGVSDSVDRSEDSFQKLHAELCGKLNCTTANDDDDDDDFYSVAETQLSEEEIASRCKERTVYTTDMFAKKFGHNKGQ